MPAFELPGISGALSNKRNLITNPCELNKFSHQISQNEFQDNILGGTFKLEGQARKPLFDFAFQLLC